MEFRISIDERALFILLIVVALVSVIGITMAQTPDPGHAWSEVECAACIGSSNLADNSVTAAKVNFNYAGSSSEGGPANSVAWTSITGKPSGFADNTDNVGLTSACSWTGWSPSCSVCENYESCCSGTQTVPTYSLTQVRCQNGVITGISRQSGCCDGSCATSCYGGYW